MVSKEPGTFDGSRNKVEDFLTEWGAYQGLNHCTYTMDTSYDCTMLFLSSIKGPQVIQWVKTQSSKAPDYVQCNGAQSVYHTAIWNNMIMEFASTFQDIMSKECARAELKILKWKEEILTHITTSLNNFSRMENMDSMMSLHDPSFPLTTTISY